jgi:hypothetical protein
MRRERNVDHCAGVFLDLLSQNRRGVLFHLCFHHTNSQLLHVHILPVCLFALFLVFRFPAPPIVLFGEIGSHFDNPLQVLSELVGVGCVQSDVVIAVDRRPKRQELIS